MENAAGPNMLSHTHHKPTNIHDLPPELLAKIAEHADESDLPALRLSSRTLSCNAERAFGVAFCTHRKHISSRRSLEGLIAIAKHREFGKHVRILSLGYSQLKQWARFPVEVAAIEKQTRFIQSGGSLRLLQEALSILHARRNESRWQEISFSIFEDKLEAAFGCREAYRGADVTCWNNDLVHAMEILTQAAAATQIEVGEINVRIPASFSWNGREAFWRNLPVFDDLFKNAILNTSDSPNPLTFSVTLDPTHKRKIFSKLVYGQGSLLVGRIKFGSYEGDLPCFNPTFLGSIPKILISPLNPVRRLYLVHSVFDESELKKLLRNLSPNLAELHFWAVRLESVNDSWAHIIMWIRHHFRRLNGVSIGKITSLLDYGDHSEMFYWGAVRQTWRDKEAVRDGLAKYAADVKREEEKLKSLYWAWTNRVQSNAF